MSQNVAESIPDHSVTARGTASAADFVKTRAEAKGALVTEPVNDIVNRTLRPLCTFGFVHHSTDSFPQNFPHKKRTAAGRVRAWNRAEKRREEQSRAKPRRRRKCLGR